MIFSQLGSQSYMIRLETGDDILSSIKRFADAKRIRAAAFEGIGSLNRARLGHYDFKTRKCKHEVFEDDLETLTPNRKHFKAEP